MQRYILPLDPTIDRRRGGGRRRGRGVVAVAGCRGRGGRRGGRRGVVAVGRAVAVAAVARSRSCVVVGGSASERRQREDRDRRREERLRQFRASSGSNLPAAPRERQSRDRRPEPAGRPRLRAVRRRVTFSRNLTLSLSRTCRCYCKYCAFATHRTHLHAPDEVLALLDGAAKRSVKELLVLTGERPEVDAGVRARLAEYGHEDFVAYVAWACERALERGLLPHTNLGVLAREDLARLREVTASQGLMLESVNPDLVAHQGSPTKHPARRLETIAAAGELRIPFTSGILVGIGESEDERVAALEALAAVHAEHGHLQEVILQNFVPHDSYYGREPAEIADAAARKRWATGIGDAPHRELPRLGDARLDRRHAPPRRRVPAPHARRRRAGAAEPRRLVARARARRRDGPRRPERQRRPHLARASVPVAARGAQAAGVRGLRADRAPVRLPALHRPRVDGAGRARRRQGALLELHPAPRERPHRAAAAAAARPRARRRSCARATARRWSPTS